MSNIMHDPLSKTEVRDMDPSSEEFEALTSAMLAEAKRRRKLNMLISAAAFAASIAIAAIGVTSGINLNEYFGTFQYGIVLMLGAALLFSFTVWILFSFQNQAEMREAAYLRKVDLARARLKDRIDRNTMTSTSS